MSVCYAKHQESILPRLTSTLGRSSPGPDRAPIAQALDQVLDRSPTLCRTNSVLCQAPRVHTPAVNKYVGALLPRTGQGPYCTGIRSSFGPESHVVPNKQVVSTLDEVVSTPCSKHKTKSCKIGQVVSTQDQVVSTLETASRNLLANMGKCVDTSTSSVDTRSAFQKTLCVNWDSVSTLAQLVTTLETFPEHHLGSFGTVCRH
ncbi:hypothetical protein Taro_031448 [Colocasia esculenta]|uniref:Uncharacterized protein n=1 Tax=Colocasia esculenta TaxID=4460 RepID=A0A843VIV3_COLES|nr:hypothetical protein [Colocasia esculenta]